MSSKIVPFYIKPHAGNISRETSDSQIDTLCKAQVTLRLFVNLLHPQTVIRSHREVTLITVPRKEDDANIQLDILK